jgi:hypothetical protein
MQINQSLADNSDSAAVRAWWRVPYISPFFFFLHTRFTLQMDVETLLR